MSTPAVLDDYDDAWNADALDLLVKVAESGADFDANTLTERGLRQPPHPNHWGSLFRSAYAAHIITPIGFRQSTRPSRAGGVCRIWRGLPNGKATQ